MFGFFFCEGPVTCFADATKSDTEKFAKWHRMMLKKAVCSLVTLEHQSLAAVDELSSLSPGQGIYLAPSQYEAGFTSLAHTEEDIECLGRTTFSPCGLE